MSGNFDQIRATFDRPSSIRRSPGGEMSFVEAEIATQAECWVRAAALARTSSEILPKTGERVAVIGCGTSLFMAQAYAVLRERTGNGETDAFAASEMPTGRRYDRVLALSRSGSTTEVLQALAQLPSMTPTVAISADPQSPIVRLAGRTIVLDFADERSIVQTRFATSALLLLRAHLAEDVGPAIADAARAIEEPLPSGAADHTQFTFLGQGWTIGLAQEAALKMREAAGAWSEAYPAMEFRHGPISVAGPKTLVWIFGPPPDGLADEIREIGATVVESVGDPLAELIRAQRLAVELAVTRGLDPDRPAHLTRAVILAPAADVVTSVATRPT
jgi:CRISPR-associated protein Cas5a/b/c